MNSAFPAFLVTFAVVQAVVFLFLLRLLDPYQHQPLAILAVMSAWGAIGATAISAFGNQRVSEMLSPTVRIVFRSSIGAPLVEEIAKGAVLVAAFLLSAWASRRFGVLRFEGLTDGLVFGAAVGIGFAFTEDILYLIDTLQREGSHQAVVDFLPRRDFFGLGSLRHSIFTAAFGAGLGLVAWSPRRILRVSVPIFGLLIAMLLHAINNGFRNFILFVQYGLDNTAGWLARPPHVDPTLLPRMNAAAESALWIASLIDYLTLVAFFVLVAMWSNYQRKIIRTELQEETDSGFISTRDRDLSSRFVRRTRWYWQLIRKGQLERARILRRLHIELARLAYFKWRFHRRIGTDSDVEEARNRIKRLKSEERFVRLVGSSSEGLF